MAKFEMIPVTSSNIKAIGHKENEKILRIEFNSGSLHEYYPVSKQEFEEMKAHPSKGKYFIRKIKDAKLNIPVDMNLEGRGALDTVLVENPTEKSLKWDENKPRVKQTVDRIQDHFSAVTKALRSKS